MRHAVTRHQQVQGLALLDVVDGLLVCHHGEVVALTLKRVHPVRGRQTTEERFSYPSDSVEGRGVLKGVTYTEITGQNIQLLLSTLYNAVFLTTTALIDVASVLKDFIQMLRY